MTKKSSGRVTINLSGDHPTKRVGSGATETELPIFSSTESVAGTVEVRTDPGKALEHLGIKIELLGQTGARPNTSPADSSPERAPQRAPPLLPEMFHDRGNFFEFCAVVRELAIPGTLTETTVRR